MLPGIIPSNLNSNDATGWFHWVKVVSSKVWAYTGKTNCIVKELAYYTTLVALKELSKSS